jgi:hypothetical protein
MLIEREARPMEIFNLFALAEDRRILREREARFERLRRRRAPAEPAARAAEKRPVGPMPHTSRPSSA